MSNHKHSDHNSKHSNHEHHHSHGGLDFLGPNVELYFSIASGVFWLIGLLLNLFTDINEIITTILFVLAMIAGGYFIFFEAVDKLKSFKFEIDFLMLVAAAGASALGKFQEGALLLFLFSLGHALEHYALRRAKRSISSLSELIEPVALLRKGDELIEVDINELKIGDIIVIKPNSNIPADGIIVEGNSYVDQSSITGESIPVEKMSLKATNNYGDQVEKHNKVYAGTVNGNGALEVEVQSTSEDSILAKMIALVREAESKKSPAQKLADKFERYYVPAVLILVILLLLAFLIVDEPFSDSFYRAMAVLIAASPCALAISTPSAVLSGISRAANEGVLAKGGGPLEALSQIKAIAFDKTGTLTKGKPELKEIIPLNNFSKTELLKISVSVEALSEHPIAIAISNDGKKLLGDIDIPRASNLQSLIARGISASYENKDVHIGNRRLIKEITGTEIPSEFEQKLSELEHLGHTAMFVVYDYEIIGIISVMDSIKENALDSLKQLKELGIKRMIMLTGDNQIVANSVGKTLGITDPLGNLLPKDKVNNIISLKKELGNVAMVGDGTNDAPALANSSVGIAMGAIGSAVALETADIALMSDDLSKIPFALRLSRKTSQITKQNIFISLGVVVVLVPLAISGLATFTPAIIAHEGSTLVVVLNALRLLRYK